MVKWKREKVQDHKFDFVEVEEFEKKDCFTRVKYSYVFLIVLKSVLVYIADLYNAGGLILSDLGDKWIGVKPIIPFSISKWIFLASIIISYVLLFIDIRKAKRIIASGDISYSFTSIIALRYYSLTSYAHWCFFEEIVDQQKTQDKIAFFVFFSFKGWKRLIFCDGPRQLINFFILLAVFKEKGFHLNLSKYGSLYRQASLAVIIFTITVFAVSACLLLTAFFLYLPLLCKIRGNLKEYCCHIIDKRIATLLLRHRKTRGKDGKTIRAPNHLNGKSPTLPNIDDSSLNREPYQMPPPMRSQSPMAFNYGGMPSPPPPPEGGFNNIPQVPIYNSLGYPIGTDQYPPRPDSNNSNSTYSDATLYSGAPGRPPYPYHPPQPQYPYQQMPLNNDIDPYGKPTIPYNYQNSNQHYDQNYHDDDDYNNYSPTVRSFSSVPVSPQNTQFENVRQPPLGNNLRYQQNQNRLYNNY